MLFLFELQPPHTTTRALGSEILDGLRDMLLEYGFAELKVVEFEQEGGCGGENGF